MAEATLNSNAKEPLEQPAMRNKPPARRLTRREKWPIHVGLFLLYVLIQTARSVHTSKTNNIPITSAPVSSKTGIENNADINNNNNNNNKLQLEAPKILANDEKLSDVKQISNNNNNNNNNNVEVDKINSESLQQSKEHSLTKSQKSAATTTTTSTETSISKEESKQGEKNKKPNSTGTPMDITTTPSYVHVTLRPRRPSNCSAPAIEQFPPELMGPDARKHGGLIIHVLVCVYTFLGLAIVCDDYFVSSLDRICEELRLSPDVAGATFMAAGSSAPELATVVIGVFFAKDDIGVSGVIGSAVFNIMFVISVCGLCSGTVSKLNWYPLCRDSFFYAISILVMLGTIYNESISWPEALLMLITYCIYCVVLSFNARLERWAKSLNLPYLPKDNDPAEESALVSYRSLQEERLSYTGPNSPITDQFRSEGNGVQDLNGDPAYPRPVAAVAPPPAPPQPQYYKAKEADPNEVSPLVRPTEGGKWGLFSWGLVYPIHYMCRATMPDCRQEKWKSWYPFTFCVSMIWISFYSYFMVWMITIIGYTLGIPDTVMGLTFVAAGVSVPDALSSLAVIKEGLGDMAVSNAVGSNVFDILVCLGLPWFIQTAMIQPGSHVNVTSRGLTYSTVSLLSTVVFLVLATHLNGWKLDRRYGVVLMIWYLIFIAFASLYELNVFGEMNPPACPSNF